MNRFISVGLQFIVYLLMETILTESEMADKRDEPNYESKIQRQ